MLLTSRYLPVKIESFFLNDFYYIWLFYTYSSSQFTILSEAHHLEKEITAQKPKARRGENWKERFTSTES